MVVHQRLVEQWNTPQPRARRRDRRKGRRSRPASMQALPHPPNQRISGESQGKKRGKRSQPASMRGQRRLSNQQISRQPQARKEERRSQLASMRVHLRQVSCQLFLYSCQVCSIEQSHTVATSVLLMGSQCRQALYHVPAFRLCNAAYHWGVHACMAHCLHGWCPSS